MRRTKSTKGTGNTNLDSLRAYSPLSIVQPGDSEPQRKSSAATAAGPGTIRQVADQLQAIADETERHERLGFRELAAVRHEVRQFRELLVRAIRGINGFLQMTSEENTILVRFRKGDWEEGPYSRAWLVEQLAKERDSRRTQQKVINRLSKRVEDLEARQRGMMPECLASLPVCQLPMRARLAAARDAESKLRDGGTD